MTQSCIPTLSYNDVMAQGSCRFSPDPDLLLYLAFEARASQRWHETSSKGNSDPGAEEGPFGLMGPNSHVDVTRQHVPCTCTYTTSTVLKPIKSLVSRVLTGVTHICGKRLRSSTAGRSRVTLTGLLKTVSISLCSYFLLEHIDKNKAHRL